MFQEEKKLFDVLFSNKQTKKPQRLSQSHSLSFEEVHLLIFSLIMNEDSW